MSPLERDWSTKPIINIINNSLAFRYVTSQIWKYYGIFGFVPNERGRIHEHKAPFHKQLSAQAFKVYSFVSLCERRIQNRHMVTVWGLCLQVRNSAFAVLLLAVIKQRCIAADAPFWIGGELPVFVVRPHAPNREARTVTVQYEYMYRATPYIYIYMYINTYIFIRGVTVRVSCTERFTGKFQMEVIVLIPLEWGLWSEQGTCVPLCSRLECTWQRERNFLIIFSCYRDNAAWCLSADSLMDTSI